MDEQLQYADLLEIPVNTCTVTTKKPRKRRMKISADRLKARAVEKSNLGTGNPLGAPASAAEREEAFAEPPVYPEPEAIAPTSRISGDGSALSGTEAQKEEKGGGEWIASAAEREEAQDAAPLRFCPPDEQEIRGFVAQDAAPLSSGEDGRPVMPQSVLAEVSRDAVPEEENGEDVTLSDVMEELPPAKKQGGNEERGREKGRKIRTERLPRAQNPARKVAAVTACLLTALISAFFLLNAFYFKLDLWGAATGAQAKMPDERLHGAFSLALPAKNQPACQDGLLVIAEKGGVYAPADGVVSAVTQAEDGTYTLEISHSDRFKTVIAGASMAFHAVGETVYRQQPVAYCGGEIQTTVAFYEDGTLLSGLKIENSVPVL